MEEDGQGAGKAWQVCSWCGRSERGLTFIILSLLPPSPVIRLPVPLMQAVRLPPAFSPPALRPPASVPFCQTDRWCWCCQRRLTPALPRILTANLPPALHLRRPVTFCCTDRWCCCCQRRFPPRGCGHRDQGRGGPRHSGRGAQGVHATRQGDVWQVGRCTRRCLAGGWGSRQGNSGRKRTPGCCRSGLWALGSEVR